MEISEELRAKALACETAEELLALAAENEIELTAEEAELILQKGAGVPEGELADDELDSVAGGAAGCQRNAHEVVKFPTEQDVRYLFDIGDEAQAFVGCYVGNETATVRITKRDSIEVCPGWVDRYKYDRVSGSPTCFGGCWQTRDRFEK